MREPQRNKGGLIIMNQFGKILGFELKYYFKNKIFVGVTVALALLIAAVMFFPRISDAIQSGEEEAKKNQSCWCIRKQQRMQKQCKLLLPPHFRDMMCKAPIKAQQKYRIRLLPEKQNALL